MPNLLSAGAMRFAHLAGFTAKGKRADDDKKYDDDDDEGRMKGRRAESPDDEPDRDDGDDKDFEPKGKKKSRRAEEAPEHGDDGDQDPADFSSEHPGDDDDDDMPKGRKAKRASDDDDDDRKMVSGRARERARCAAIFAEPAAGRMPDLAASLAFETSLSAEAAISVLNKAAARAAASDSSARRDRNPRLDAGDAPMLSGSTAIQASWDRAFGRVVKTRNA